MQYMQMRVARIFLGVGRLYPLVSLQFESDRVEGWSELGAKEKVMMVIDRVCRNEAVARVVEKMWRKRFALSVPTYYHRP